jgi:hypothetical protein
MTTEMALHLASVVVEAEVLNVLKLLKPITFLVSFDEYVQSTVARSFNLNIMS